jgi:Xaa-Pro dipeptidase
MNLTRRQLLKAGALGLAAPFGFAQGKPAAAAALTTEQTQELPPSFNELRPLGDRARPITTEEFQQRVAQAQRLMREAKPRFGAVYLAPGSSLYYYTGIRWGGGERLFSLVIPATGEPLVVCPAFEEGRAQELLRWPMEVRVWQEDESPYAVVARWLAERGVRTGRIGVEETMRFQFFDGLRKAAPSFTYASADPSQPVAGCARASTSSN